MEFLPTKARTYVVFCYYSKTVEFLNIHDLNTNLNFLSGVFDLMFKIYFCA
jgi:hypothetical protein